MCKSVSCCPAKDASGKSSAVAEDLTATSGSFSPIFSENYLYADKISSFNSGSNSFSLIFF